MTPEQLIAAHDGKPLTDLVRAAIVQGLEAAAKWYGEKGWLLDEDDVPAAIRALIAEQGTIKPPSPAQDDWNAAIELAAGKLSIQHRWITNTAASTMVLQLKRPSTGEQA